MNELPVNSPLPDLMDDRQAALYLNVLPRTVRLWRSHQGLPFLRITGKTVRIRTTDLQQWLARHRVATNRG